MVPRYCKKAGLSLSFSIFFFRSKTIFFKQIVLMLSMSGEYRDYWPLNFGGETTNFFLSCLHFIDV
jgi:hypothetical protein